MRGTKIRFEYPDDLAAHWNPARPEWSQVVNACSLLMPYLEPFLIDAIREATKRIDDPGLLAEAKAYMGQEAHHYKQHRRFIRVLPLDDTGMPSCLGRDSNPREHGL